jgi:hypothetical protein
MFGFLELLEYFTAICSQPEETVIFSNKFIYKNPDRF